MATVMLMHWPDVTPDQYDQVRERARWDTDVPDGAKLHVCGFTDDGVHILDVWESQEALMPKFLIEASYTTEGVKGVQSAGGSSRRDAVAKVAESVGGSLESFHFGFGENDAYVVLDLPDNEAAAAVAIAVNAAGGATAKTTVLLTPEQVDEAAKRSVDYRPPVS